MNEQQRPWDRQPDEPNLWYDRFERYRLMGPSRSLLRCVNTERAQKGRKQSAYVPGSWREAAERWQWAARCEAWDQAERERIAAEWQERQRAIREADYGAGQRLRELAGRILDEAPKFVTASRKRLTKGRPAKLDAQGNIIDPGEPEQIVVTLALNADLAIRAIDTASKLERQAAEMTAPRQAIELTGKDGGPIQHEDVTDLSDDERARRILALLKEAGLSIAPEE